MSIVMSYQNELMNNTVADVNLILELIQAHIEEKK